jgi:hypothetical protein
MQCPLQLPCGCSSKRTRSRIRRTACASGGRVASIASSGIRAGRRGTGAAGRGAARGQRWIAIRYSVRGFLPCGLFFRYCFLSSAADLADERLHLGSPYKYLSSELRSLEPTSSYETAHGLSRHTPNTRSFSRSNPVRDIFIRLRNTCCH